MKFIYIIIMLFASFLLTSCENEETNKDYTQNVSDEKNDTILSGEKSERISYNEYIQLYDNDPFSTNNDSRKNATTPSEIENKEENENIEDVIPQQIIKPNELATYSTPLLSSSEERINNLEIVCQRLNNFILNPNETFSYNNVAGPYGPDDGFEEATILLSDGSKTKGYGGGVCQLSSTLYNVVKNVDNLEITERHHHSAPVAYVPEGEDATVSLQSGLDFKFVNNNNFPIRFEAECADGYVTVWATKEI